MIVSIWICEVRKFHPRVSLPFYRMFSICMTAAERIEDVANARAGGDERLCLHSLRWVDVARVNICIISCGSDVSGS